MSIELVFRAAFYVVSVLLIFYTRTVVVSSAVLALAAWLAFGHPEDNSAGQEVLAFFITWLSAALTAALIGCVESASWVIDLEWRLVSSAWPHRRQTNPLRLHDAVSWLFGCFIATAAYVATEVAGYDRGTFFRVPTLSSLLLIGLLIYVYDQIAGRDDYRILPRDMAYLHKLVLFAALLAIAIDILARDPDFWVYLVPVTLVWCALQLLKIVLDLRPTAPGPAAKKLQ